MSRRIGLRTIHSAGGMKLYVPEFYDGFETGDFRKWNDAVNYVIVTSPVHHGKYAATDSNDSSNLLQHNITVATNTYFIRFYAYFSSIPGGSGYIYVVAVTNFTFVLDLIYQSGNPYVWLFDGSNSATGSTPITAGWHCIDMEINTGPSAAESVWLDGNLQIQQTWNEPSVNIGGFYLYCRSSSNPSWVYDDIIGDVVDPTCVYHSNIGV
jgi:hypothetical protein